MKGTKFMNKLTYAFPDGKFKCLTMSYDDGRSYDRRLVEIFNNNGIKGTFHLNASKLDGERYLSPEELPSLFAGHEISCHMYTHPFPKHIPERSVLEELRLDREGLEAACGYIVRGMSYPYGDFNDRVADLCRIAGMEYSRTTRSTQNYSIPEDFLLWHPTCHHRENISDRVDAFLKVSRYKRLELFYVWGHSFEFNDNNNWEIIEQFCGKMAGHDHVWYATNIEIIDYINALKAVRVSQALDMAYNLTATDVWFTVNGDPVKIPAGQTVKF